MPRHSHAPLPFDPIEEAARQWRSHGWDQAVPGMAAVTSIMRAHQILLARVDETLRPFRLSFARYEVLMLLSFSRSGSMALSRIGSLLQVHPTSVTNAIDRLEAEMLVERRAHQTDRRALLAEITSAGRKIADEATAVLNAQVFSSPGLSGTECEELIRTVQVLRRNAGDFSTP